MKNIFSVTNTLLDAFLEETLDAAKNINILSGENKGTEAVMMEFSDGAVNKKITFRIGPNDRVPNLKYQGAILEGHQRTLNRVNDKECVYNVLLKARDGQNCSARINVAEENGEASKAASAKNFIELRTQVEVPPLGNISFASKKGAFDLYYECRHKVRKYHAHEGAKESQDIKTIFDFVHVKNIKKGDLLEFALEETSARPALFFQVIVVDCTKEEIQVIEERIPSFKAEDFSDCALVKEVTGRLVELVGGDESLLRYHEIQQKSIRVSSAAFPDFAAVAIGPCTVTAPWVSVLDDESEFLKVKNYLPNVQKGEVYKSGAFQKPAFGPDYCYVVQIAEMEEIGILFFPK